MKKSRLIALCFCATFACAQMTITARESVSAELTPDVLRGQMSFEEESQNANSIKEHLNALVSTVKHFDSKGEFCRGGGYQLSPRYSYKDQKQTFLGYTGMLSFRCEFTSIDQYNVLIAKIDAIKHKNIRTHQGSLSWEVSAKAQDDTRIALRSKLLQLTQKQAVIFSKETGMNCAVSSVAYEGTTPVRPVMMNTMLLKSASPLRESIPSEEPMLRDETLVLNATVEYSCIHGK